MLTYRIRVSAFTPRGDFEGIIDSEDLNKEEVNQLVENLVSVAALTKLVFETTEGVIIVLTEDILAQSVLGFKAISSLG